MKAAEGAGISNTLLNAWMRGGTESRLDALAGAESRMVAALQSAVRSSTGERLQQLQDAARDVEDAASALLDGLSEQPSPDARVNAAYRRAWRASQRAATVIRSLAETDRPLTARHGREARASIERAQRENWEAALTFAGVVDAADDDPPMLGFSSVARCVEGLRGRRCPWPPSRGTAGP